MSSSEINVDGVKVRAEAEAEGEAPELRAESPEPGLHLVRVRVPGAASGRVRVAWTEPLGDAAGFWHPAAGWSRSLRAPWSARLVSSSTRWAPVACLLGPDGRSRATLAVSEVLRPVEIGAGVEEHGDGFGFEVRAPVAGELVLRLDRRRLPYARCLAGVVEWWEDLGGPPPLPVPELGRGPAYSTWYSLGKSVTAAEVERQAELAGPLGMGLSIVDD